MRDRAGQPIGLKIAPEWDRSTPLVVRQARPVPLSIALAEYRRILEQLPRDRADALRLAQLKVREQYPNPRYWAAFILIGEGNLPLDPS